MAGVRYRVLVVDDEADIRALLRMSLEPDYEVVEAVNGLDAQFKYNESDPDIAIIDIMMPLMDGRALSQKLRSKPGNEGFPIIHLSALDSREDIRAGYASGANLYLTKPFDPSRVTKNVAMLLEDIPPRQKALTIEQVHERELAREEKIKRARERHAAEEKAAGRAADLAARDMRARERQARIDSAHHDDHDQPIPGPPAAANPSSDGIVLSHIEKSQRQKVRETRKRIAEEAAPKKPSAAKPRILLVDDEEDFRLILRTALEREYEVVTAENGFVAMNRIPEVEPDIFIIDGMMPKMSGYQLIDMIKSASNTRSKPVIFISAKGGDRDVRMIKSKGVAAYLIKPFSPDEMIHELEKVVADPHFEVGDKARTLEDLLHEYGLKQREQNEEKYKKTRWKTYGTLNKFLKEHRKDDPFGDDTKEHWEG